MGKSSEIKTYIWKPMVKDWGIETCGNYDYKVRICPTVMVYLTFVPLSHNFT
jgi:hypothetical protein